MQQQVDLFFDTYLTTFDNNFSRWKSQCLHFTIATSNKHAATVYAKWYLNLEQDYAEEDDTFLDVTHERTYSAKQWLDWLNSQCDGSRDNPFLNSHRAAIVKIADGISLWNHSRIDNQVVMSRFQLECKERIFTMKHHTQSTEAGVQDISMCSKNQRTEYDASALSMVRSDHVQAVKKEIATERQNHRERGNQHINKQGQRVSSRSIEVGKQQEEEGRLLRRNYHPSATEQAMSSKRAFVKKELRARGVSDEEINKLKGIQSFKKYLRDVCLKGADNLLLMGTDNPIEDALQIKRIGEKKSSSGM
mmetsp:Transcript_26611/g.39421  ORF Transcript_26611/g.39421 Transcript_26611/m.39421 type:complete len:305 (+) Transcript_26611:380-1294(+)